MNEWVSSCGQSSLECHRLPPRTKKKNQLQTEEDKGAVSVSKPPPRPPLYETGRQQAHVRQHMTKKEVTADEAADVPMK